MRPLRPEGLKSSNPTVSGTLDSAAETDNSRLTSHNDKSPVVHLGRDGARGTTQVSDQLTWRAGESHAHGRITAAIRPELLVSPRRSGGIFTTRTPSGSHRSGLSRGAVGRYLAPSTSFFMVRAPAAICQLRSDVDGE